ncbi:MAG: MoaD/ThiS family protein [Dehalococcoidales bacterium]|nr:MoaD/ThiS family protein [Dehalococcoidales bacterium]MDP6501692.1 MoaD/ThiS family protein [Dehalococcoidales bacterium]MDP6632905.1 MoaD/ThiS family protein [Dehalococcoidales bacterium]MDP7525374.1 MoaD/ThiS family protein [Dehalococcoidales bacterium]
MARVRLEILPWISDILDNRSAGQVVLEEAVDEGATVGDLVRRLGRENQAFGDVMFDTETDRLSGYVMIVLNEQIVEAFDGLETGVKDGDVIKLLPVIAGG